jgi:hypothetical protein
MSSVYLDTNFYEYDGEDLFDVGILIAICYSHEVSALIGVQGTQECINP